MKRDENHERQSQAPLLRLTPIFERDPRDPPMIANAAIVTCMATGKTLASQGGGSPALSPEIVDQLDMHKTGGKSRVICDAATFDQMAASLNEVREWISNWSPNFEQDPEWPEANARLDAAIRASKVSDPA